MKIEQLAALNKRRTTIENILKVFESNTVTAATGIRPIVIVKTGRTPEDTSGDTLIMSNKVNVDIIGHLRAELNVLNEQIDEMASAN